MSRPFPKHPLLQGIWEPWPMEGECRDLPLVGEVPHELAGTLYRIGPNPQFAPRADYHLFDGDGMLHAFEFERGRVHYRNRWVRTPRFLAERAAGASLFGGLSAPRADAPEARGIAPGPANTNVVWHAGRLLALVELGLPPVEIDPDTLETRGVFDFDGALRRPVAPGIARLLELPLRDGTIDASFTAHPKLDPETGELLAFGYQLFPPHLLFYEIGADGRLLRCAPIDTPFPAMVHDFALTQQHVVFPIFPATLRLERIARGENAVGWEPELGTRIAVLPRGADPSELRWFELPACFAFHPLNASTRGDRIEIDLPVFESPPIPAVGNAKGVGGQARLTRFELDLASGRASAARRDERSIEFPRCDERFSGRPLRWGYAVGDGDVGRGFHAILRYDLRDAKSSCHALGPDSTTSEAVFVPRSASAGEGSGFLLAVVYRAAERRSDLLVLDAERIEAAPLAAIALPHRVPAGFHGNWRPSG